MLKNRPQLSRNMDKNNALAVFAGLLALSVVAAVLYPLVPPPRLQQLDSVADIDSCAAFFWRLPTGCQQP